VQDIDRNRRLVLSAWRRAPDLFTGQERAALAFTEAVTVIGDARNRPDHPPDATTFTPSQAPA